MMAEKTIDKQKENTGAIAWAGYAFETICLKHIDQIRNALDLQGVFLRSCSWKYTPLKGDTQSGAQIDLLFDEKMASLPSVEMKFGKPFLSDKHTAKEIMNKMGMFSKILLYKKAISFALVASVWESNGQFGQRY